MSNIPYSAFNISSGKLIHLVYSPGHPRKKFQRKKIIIFTPHYSPQAHQEKQFCTQKKTFLCLLEEINTFPPKGNIFYNYQKKQFSKKKRKVLIIAQKNQKVSIQMCFECSSAILYVSKT